MLTEKLMPPKSRRKVSNRLKVLIAEKEIREHRKITYRQIAQETGIATSTLVAYAQRTVNRYDSQTLEALCEYFNCEISDILILVQARESKTSQDHDESPML